MASEFIGYIIQVTLRSPAPKQQLQGVVADVIEQQLVLKDGMEICLVCTRTDVCQ